MLVKTHLTASEFTFYDIIDVSFDNFTWMYLYVICDKC